MESKGKEMSIQRFLRVLCLSVLLSPALHADDSQQQVLAQSEVRSNGLEYVDQNGVIQQFGDSNGNIISREAFIERSHQIEAQFNASANRMLGEAHEYIQTASEGDDKVVTQSAINGIEQSKRDVHQQHAQAEEKAQSYKPRVYEKPKVLISE